jgi:hypothetical protein
LFSTQKRSRFSAISDRKEYNRAMMRYEHAGNHGILYTCPSYGVGMRGFIPTPASLNRACMPE